MSDQKHDARMYAESVADQNREALADELRTLLAEQPEFFTTLTKVVNQENVMAAEFLNNLSNRQRREALKWIIPAARIGLAYAKFAMEDKYAPENGGGNG